MPAIEGHFWVSYQLRKAYESDSARISDNGTPVGKYRTFAKLDSGKILRYDAMTAGTELSALYSHITDMRYLGHGKWQRSERIA